MHVLPRPLPNEVIKGEHFVLVNLLRSFPGGSSQVEAAPKPFVRPDHLPLIMQDPKPVPKVMKKKKKKTEKAKATDARLEGFVNWTNLGVSESAEEEEAEMSGLASGFSVRMRKPAASAHGETALGAATLCLFSRLQALGFGRFPSQGEVLLEALGEGG